MIAALLNATAGRVQESNAPVHSVGRLVEEANARLDEVTAFLHEANAHLHELARRSPETRGLVNEVRRRSLSIPSEPNAPCASSCAEASMVRRDDRGVVRRELVEKLVATRRASTLDVSLLVAGGAGVAALAFAGSAWVVLPLAIVSVTVMCRRIVRLCPRCTQPLWAARSPRPFAPRCCTGCDLILVGEGRGETYFESRAVAAQPHFSMHDEKEEDMVEKVVESDESKPSGVDSELATLEAGGTPYRQLALPPPAPDKYLAAWARLEASRARVGKSILIALAAIAVGGSMCILLGNPGVSFVFGLLVVLGVVVAFASQLFLCPRCEKPFFRDGKRNGMGAAACLHCGLRIGTSELDAAGHRVEAPATRGDAEK